MSDLMEEPVPDPHREPEVLIEARQARAYAQARARVAAEPHVRAALAADLPKVCLPFDLRAEGAKWDDTDGPERLWLLRPEHVPLLPVGTCVVSILGTVRIVGIDPLDTADTRMGFMSVGLLDAQIVCEDPWHAP